MADEVRNTQESTSQIRGTLQALQKQIVDAVDCMESCQDQAQLSEEQAEQANLALADAEKRMATITSMCSEIARAVEEQSEACQLITGSMDVIGRGHQETVEHSKASLESDEMVNKNAGQLKCLAASFWNRRTPVENT